LGQIRTVAEKKRGVLKKGHDSTTYSRKRKKTRGRNDGGQIAIFPGTKN